MTTSYFHDQTHSLAAVAVLAVVAAAVAEEVVAVLIADLVAVVAVVRKVKFHGYWEATISPGHRRRLD